MTPSAEELNSHIGRTTDPPDLLTLIDEHLRKMFENVYAHPISLNTPKPWLQLELGYVMVMQEYATYSDRGITGYLAGQRLNIGTIHPDRVVMNVDASKYSFYSYTFHATDPLFLQKLTDFFDKPIAKYINEFIRRR